MASSKSGVGRFQCFLVSCLLIYKGSSRPQGFCSIRHSRPPLLVQLEQLFFFLLSQLLLIRVASFVHCVTRLHFATFGRFDFKLFLVDLPSTRSSNTPPLLALEVALDHKTQCLNLGDSRPSSFTPGMRSIPSFFEPAHSSNLVGSAPRHN